MSTKTSLSRPQKLHLELLRLATFNDFDGDRVADDLVECRGLWESFIFDRGAYHAQSINRRSIAGETERKLPVEPIDTIKLRDLAAGYWNVDTLYILPTPGKEDELFALASSWEPDEINWYDGLDAGPMMLRVWWD